MFQGSMVALVTPMLENGDVDYDGLTRLIEFHVAEGTDAIVAVGTTGECATLSPSEHMKVVKHCKDVLGGRLPLIAGTGGNSTAEAIELTQMAAEIGVDACLSVVPYYNKPTQKGLIAHFKAIANSTQLPVILYNVPGRTVVDMTAETTAELSKIDNIIGIKEAEGSLERTLKLLSLCEEGFIVLSGEDSTCCETMLAGGKGVISVTSNVAPKLMAEMCKLAIAGQVEEAKAVAIERNEPDSALAAFTIVGFVG